MDGPPPLISRKQPETAGDRSRCSLWNELETSYYPWQDAQQDYQERDDLSWTRGKHNLKFGASFMRFTKNMGLQAEPQGTYVFSTPSFSGDAYVNFLMGFASTFSQLNDQSRRHLVNNTTSMYALDNWKVTPRLTLNLGLRYDMVPVCLGTSEPCFQFCSGGLRSYAGCRV